MTSMEDKSYSFALDDEQYQALLLLLGYATGAAFKAGDKKMGFAFLRLANKINENNPNWTPYEMPEEAGTEGI